MRKQRANEVETQGRRCSHTQWNPKDAAQQTYRPRELTRREKGEEPQSTPTTS
jgi:hypothetical protein